VPLRDVVLPRLGIGWRIQDSLLKEAEPQQRQLIVKTGAAVSDHKVLVERRCRLVSDEANGPQPACSGLLDQGDRGKNFIAVHGNNLANLASKGS
jgi:hypothetical protein